MTCTYIEKSWIYKELVQLVSEFNKATENKINTKYQLIIFIK